MLRLDEIGLKYGTDKASKGHNYLQFYERFLYPIRTEQIVLVEAGIGGNEYPDRGGESLRTWREYFTDPIATICGFDKYPKTGLKIPGCFILQIDQTDETELIKAFTHPAGSEITDPTIDVFIDDASHVNPLSIRTFEIMFPLLKPGGIYIWEDIHTSFWKPEYLGSPERNANGTAMHFLKDLVTGLHVDTLEVKERGPWDGHISEMYFMRNTCVIIKRK